MKYHFYFHRDRDNDSGEVRVYPGKLQVSQAFCIVPVESNTTVGDLIRESLPRFGLEDSNCDDFRCSEILLDRGGKNNFQNNCADSNLLNTIFSVTERVLSWHERPWEIMKQLGKDSIRQMELMRFYLQLKQDPHGPNVALFVGNLPPNLSERNYETILNEYLGKGSSGGYSIMSNLNLQSWFILYQKRNFRKSDPSIMNMDLWL